VDGHFSGRETPVALSNPLLLTVGRHEIIFKMSGKRSSPHRIDIKEDEINSALRNIDVE
jgi:hypothetical protein